jgi:hypothetical protein
MNLAAALLVQEQAGAVRASPRHQSRDAKAKPSHSDQGGWRGKEVSTSPRLQVFFRS